MPKFRKKPVVVEAFQWLGRSWDVPDWARHHRDLDFPVTAAVDFEDGCEDDSLCVQTLHGRTRAILGDWVIRGTSGDLWPCKPDIFEATYEPVGGLTMTITDARLREIRERASLPMNEAHYLTYRGSMETVLELLDALEAANKEIARLMDRLDAPCKGCGH